MSARTLIASQSLWMETWAGLRRRGGGERESACVWVGTRAGDLEKAHEVVYLDDLPGTVGRRLAHRTSRDAVKAMLAQARALGMVIVADIHTHPGAWVDLSEVDRAHPIEYRVGLLALVFPHFATGTPDALSVGIHEYAGGGAWKTIDDDCTRFRVVTSVEAE